MIIIEYRMTIHFIEKPKNKKPVYPNVTSTELNFSFYYHGL